MAASEEYWAYLDQLVAASRIVVDRPRGSIHPRYTEVVYPLDYGYLDGTRSMDGGGIDVWIGSGGAGRVQGVICTVDLYKRDAEIKILMGCTEAELQTILSLTNEGALRGMLVRRSDTLLISTRTREGE